MAGYICIGVLAAFGALSILWALLGWMLPQLDGGTIVVFSSPEMRDGFQIRRYIFLRDLGLLTCPLLIVDQGMTEKERRLLENLHRGIEICSRSELPERLELERNRIG